MLKFLNSAVAWLHRKLSRLVRKWLRSVSQYSTRLYHEYIEGMIGEYAEVRQGWRDQGKSEVIVALKSFCFGTDFLWGISRLTFDRCRRALSLFFYGTEQVLRLADSFKPSLVSLFGQYFFSTLHWMTGSVGAYKDRIELKLSPVAEVIDWGEGAEVVFGFTKNQVLGKDAIASFIPPIESSGRLLSDLIQNICTSPQRYVLNVNENQTCEGVRCWVLWVNIPVYGDAGELIEVICVGTQIDDPVLIAPLVEWWKAWLERFLYTEAAQDLI